MKFGFKLVVVGIIKKLTKKHLKIIELADQFNLYFHIQEKNK